MQTVAATSIAGARSLRVRPATLLQCCDISNIHNQYVGSGPYTMEDVRWTPAEVKRQLDGLSDREGVLVCQDELSRTLGWGKIKRYSDRAGYRIACEISVYVDRGERRRGVGDHLLPEVLQLAHRMGYRHSVAKVITKNLASIRFHLKHGYEIVGVQKGIGVIAGEIEDVTILQYRFDA
ncbi:MAG: GNAT family N-acetyltransferase [Planctomycetota bacterium]